MTLFLSTPSARRATALHDALHDVAVISIHALREEGDQSDELSVAVKSDFYPRPPRGGRRWSTSTPHRPDSFLSTPSARRATVAGYAQPHDRQISIHALREEGDLGQVVPLDHGAEFLSTPSARRATPSSPPFLAAVFHFYPRPPRGGRPRKAGRTEGAGYFYPRPPRGGRHPLSAKWGCCG